MVALLAIQLTGLNCLSDYDLVQQNESLVQAPPIEHVNGLSLIDADSCPCHLTFHTASLVPVTLVSVFTTILSDAPPQLVSAFIHFLFRPPLFA